jgi:hypothetical protein
MLLNVILHSQLRNGSWPYVLRGDARTRPGAGTTSSFGYSLGTFMGVSALELARGAIEGAGRRGVSVDWARIARQRARGRRRLEKDMKAFLHDCEEWGQSGGWHGSAAHWCSNEMYPYYGLFAMGCAAWLAGFAPDGREGWYVRGVRLLLRLQQADGGWRLPSGDGSDSISTAFSMLFVGRYWEVMRHSPHALPYTTPTK